jgi:hypothetical protein
VWCLKSESEPLLSGVEFVFTIIETVGCNKENISSVWLEKQREYFMIKYFCPTSTVSNMLVAKRMFS